MLAIWGMYQGAQLTNCSQQHSKAAESSTRGRAGMEEDYTRSICLVQGNEKRVCILFTFKL